VNIGPQANHFLVFAAKRQDLLPPSIGSA